MVVLCFLHSLHNFIVIFCLFVVVLCPFILILCLFVVVCIVCIIFSGTPGGQRSVAAQERASVPGDTRRHAALSSFSVLFWSFYMSVIILGLLVML
uniref:Uncharacterized protein n=1 Tax=Amphiprion ocellaris TaxID=80972 RepID=A0AAQ5XXL3_AMPOC